MRVKGAKGKNPKWSEEKNAFLRDLLSRPLEMPSGHAMSVTLKERFGDYHSPDSVWSQISKLRKLIAEEEIAENPGGNVPPAFKALIGRINHWHRTGESTLPVTVSQEAKERMGVKREIQSR